MNCAEYQELLVAYLEGLLEDSQKQAVEEHVKQCETCRTELEGLQTLQQRLVDSGKALAQGDLENQVMNRIIREQSARLKSAAQAGMGLRLRRLIMRSSIVKLTVAAAVILAAAGGIFLWTGTKSGVALADVLSRVEQVQAFMYHLTMHVKGPQQNMMPGEADSEGTVTVSNEYGIKLDMTITVPATGMKLVQQMYMLPQQNEMVTIHPGIKTYDRVKLDQTLADQMKKQANDPRALLRQILQCRYEELGRSVVDGVEVEGFQTTDPTYAGGAFGEVDVKVWAAVKTWLPVRVEMSMKGNEQMQMQGTVSDFQWDIPAQAADFTPVIAADYTPGFQDGVQMPPMTEETALEGLKHCLAFTGHYPENFSVPTLVQAGLEYMTSQTPEAQKLRQQLDEMKSDNEKMRRTMEATGPIYALGGFYTMLVQEKKEAAYYGKLVRPGDVAQVLMRWKIGANEYRVIFADLHVATVDTDTLTKLEAGLPK